MIQRTFARGLTLVAIVAATAIAQTTSGGGVAVTSTAPAGVSVAFSGALGGPLNRVTGQPFSAQEETETIQTLADGTHIKNGTQKVMHYRDSLGRTRTERTAMQPPGFMAASAGAPPIFIEIADPVAGYRYSFDSTSPTAHRSPFGPTRVAKMLPALAMVTAPASSRALFAQVTSTDARQPRPEISTEQLGTETIEGVLAEGTRMTTTYPVGFFGNDRPVTTTAETWTSRELGMVVLTRTSDPRTGETTMRLTNISRTEPAPSLFQPPAGYAVMDPSGQPAEQ